MRGKSLVRPVFWAVLASVAALPYGIERLQRRQAQPPPAAPKAPVSEIILSGRIGRNGSVDAALRKAGLTRPQSYEAVQAMRDVFDPRRSRPGDTFLIKESKAGKVVDLKYWPDKLGYIWLHRAPDGGLMAQKQVLPVQETDMGAYGSVQSSLWEAMAAQKIPADVIVQFAEIFSWQVDFLTEPRPGDSFKLVWKKKTNELSSKNGEIVFAQYHGREAGDHAAVLYNHQYYDFEGESLRKEFLRAPLNYRRISSYFTNSRYHPILRQYMPHHGIDYAAAYGTPVVSIGQGVVTKAGWNGPIGRMIEVRHNATYSSIYGHLSRFAANLRPGRHVEQGQVIGFVGSTGRSTGPHLHFGFKRDGSLINFFSLHIPPGKRLSAPEELAAFSKVKKDSLVEAARLRRMGEPPSVVALPVEFASGASK